MYRKNLGIGKGILLSYSPLLISRSRADLLTPCWSGVGGGSGPISGGDVVSKVRAGGTSRVRAVFLLQVVGSRKVSCVVFSDGFLCRIAKASLKRSLQLSLSSSTMVVLLTMSVC